MKIQVWEISKVKPYESNVKIHDPAQVTKIAQSIERFGWDQPIVVDKDGIIIKGHGRRLAAIKLGIDKVPVLVRDDLTPDQAKAARLADNRVALSGIDTKMLQDELASLELNIEGIFDKKELDFMTADLSTINTEAFSLDLDEDVREQSRETIEKIDETDSKEVKISKVLGFNGVSVREERHLAKFMAIIEAKYELGPAAALVQFAKDYAAETK
ncbi:ParB/Srx family N-terminal domain-containing protein [Ferrovum sp.]|uniref:ParB/Srx family N-terminal domain-containing protein n=1 Tax=Ferrovum sp. TaxID=2609467 RepID=UPI002634827C|nr:ParB/Srx family N-terminal domain-containing protein [Ferrovum sp.]